MLNVDWETIEFEFGDELDLFYEIFEDYCQSWKKHLDDVQSAISENDFHKAMISAHTLKGVVANFYCDPIRDVAFELEQDCKQEKSDRVNELVDQYTQMHQNLQSQLEDFFKKNSVLKAS